MAIALLSLCILGTNMLFLTEDAERFFSSLRLVIRLKVGPDHVSVFAYQQNPLSYPYFPGAAESILLACGPEQ